MKETGTILSVLLHKHAQSGGLILYIYTSLGVIRLCEVVFARAQNFVCTFNVHTQDNSSHLMHHTVEA